MNITMQLSSAGSSEQQLANMTREMALNIGDETDISADLATGETAPGAKGDPITIGTVVLTFLTSGAAVALFEVLKSYFDRDSSLNIAFKKPDGSEVKVSAQNMKPEKLQETISRLQEILER